MNEILDEAIMYALNMQVDIEGKDAKGVAHQFLEGRRLISS